MKTSQLFSLVIAIALLNSTAFAGNTKTETKDSSLDSSEELYVNPLEEVLAMQAIPDIILDDDMPSASWLYVNAEEDYLNPLNVIFFFVLFSYLKLQENLLFNIRKLINFFKSF
mgnify:CR=1 FL=1